ncbi:MAG: sugar transferase [Acidimicrobiales bacterium]
MAKRSFDVVAGAVLCLIALPLIVLLALGTAISLRSWPFFTQTRVGRRGQPFRVLKLRTLPRSFPRYAEKRSLEQLRLPWLSRFLRSHHLDELPQLWHVPFGTMSLVGPRPEMPHLHAIGDPHFATARTSLRPGCTGLWQVSCDAQGMIWENPEYDEFYIRHTSLKLDLWILWRSVLILAGRREATIDQEGLAQLGTTMTPSIRPWPQILFTPGVAIQHAEHTTSSRGPEM